MTHTKYRATTLARLIAERLSRKDGQIKKKYSKVIFRLFDGEKIRKEWRGRGRSITLSDSDYWAALEIAGALNLSVLTGNDAPKGGKNGDFVRLTETGRGQVKGYMDKVIIPAREREAAERAEREAEERARRAEREERRARLMAESDAKLDSVLRSVDITGTDAYFLGRERKEFYHELAGELHVLNTLTFRTRVKGILDGLEEV